MDKKHGPKGSSSKDVQTPPGAAAPADRGPAGPGSNVSGFYINERGQTCYGNECVTLAVDEDRREIVVNVKPTATCDIDPVVEALRRTLGKGARTVYEVESVIKDEPK